MRTTFACAILMVWAASGCDDRTPPAASTPAALGTSLDAEKVEASLAAASQYLQTGQIAEAEAILRTLIGRAPAESRGHELLGQALMQKAIAAEKAGDAAAAIDFKKQAYESYRKAVECDPNTAGLQHSAGLMAMAAGERDAALAHFQAAEKLDASNPQYALYAAQLLMQMQRLDEAEAALQRVLAVNPNEPYAHASMAMLLLEREQFDAALNEIAVARQALPDDVGLRAQHAKVYRHMNQARPALELLIGLDENDRAQEAVAFEIAAAYDTLGENAKAGAAWELCAQGQTQTPDRFVHAAVQAARMYLLADQPGDALRCAQAAEGTAPDSPEVKQLMTHVRKALQP